jgi:hypothetical protein
VPNASPVTYGKSAAESADLAATDSPASPYAEIAAAKATDMTIVAFIIPVVINEHPLICKHYIIIPRVAQSH